MKNTVQFELIELIRRKLTDVKLLELGFDQTTIWRYRNVYYPRTMQKVKELMRK